METLLESLESHVRDIVRSRPGQFIDHRAGRFYTEQHIADGWMLFVSANSRRLRELDNGQVEELYLAYRRGWLEQVREMTTNGDRVVTD